ncbi:MAG: HigA family addiction module antitoxin [Gemmatimonadota bacterium]
MSREPQVRSDALVDDLLDEWWIEEVLEEIGISTDRPPTHPGEMLREEFLEPLGMTQTELARRIGVAFHRVNDLINGRCGVTPDTALRLARLFGTSPNLWMRLQAGCDLYRALRTDAAKTIRRIEPLDRESRRDAP